MAMDCPTCHTENAADAATCSSCGKPLREAAAPPRKPARPSRSRRRPPDETEGADADPAAWRAYRLSLWSLIPFAGLLLGPVAAVLGVLAARKISDEDEPSRNRAKVAVLFGTLITLTQWLGVALMIYGW